MINVTNPSLPPLEKYQEMVRKIFDSGHLTNGGPVFREFKEKLESYLGVKNILPVANGTLALQLAFKLLKLKGNVATSAFSFAATASSLKWEKLTPIFVDIDESSLNISIDCLEDVIKSNHVSGLLAVHVYGNPCEVEEISRLSENHNLKVVYDAAHAFACNYAGSSVLQWGDISTISFHSTKLFHSVEGGALIIQDDDLYQQAERLINFGFDSTRNIVDIGINAKMSEFHAAMGVCLLDEIDDVISRRLEIIDRYKRKLEVVVDFQQWHCKSNNNGAYMPILLESSEQLEIVVKEAANQGINVRKYFSPSLSDVEVYSGKGNCRISTDISERVLCLPLYIGLENEDVDLISKLVKKSLITQ